MIVKVIDLEEMGKSAALIKEKTLSSFVFTWKPLLDFLLDIKRKQIVPLGFDDQNC